jgi:hypothetical protein
MRMRHLIGLLMVATLGIPTAPLYAQRQQQNVAKLKADARNLVGIIGGDRTKTRTYCKMMDLSWQMNEATREKGQKKEPRHYQRR